MKNFSSRIKQLRGDLTLQAFANKIGINLKTYQHYEAGKRKPNVSAILQIAVSCGVSSDWLLGLSENDKSHNHVLPCRMIEENSCPECAKKDAVIAQLRLDNSLRATFISMMDEAGVSAHVTDAITGHAKQSMHARYTQPSGAALLEAVKKAIAPLGV